VLWRIAITDALMNSERLIAHEVVYPTVGFLSRFPCIYHCSAFYAISYLNLSAWPGIRHLGVYNRFDRFHRREEQDFFDVGRIGEEHHETVNADAPAARWRKAMFKSINETLVYVLCFVITLGPLSHLSSKRARCSNGSFSSVYALQNSFPHIKPSKRSQRPGRDRCHLARGDMTCG